MKICLFSPQVMSNSGTLWMAAYQAFLSLTISWNLPKLMSIESVMLSNHLILCCPLLLLSSVFPSIRVFPMSQLFAAGGQGIGASASASASSEYSGLISFRIDWFDFLAVQGTLKSLLQHHNSKASLLWRSAFFMVQLSHPYVTTGPITSWQIKGEKIEAVTDFLFLGNKITVDGDCSHEIRRCLLLERKAMTNLDSVLQSKDVTLMTKVCVVKAVIFPVVI